MEAPASLGWECAPGPVRVARYEEGKKRAVPQIRLALLQARLLLRWSKS